MPNPMSPEIHQQKKSFLLNQDVHYNKQSFHELVSLATAEYDRLRRSHQALQADLQHPQIDLGSTGGVAHGWRVTEPKRLGTGSSSAGICWPSPCAEPAGKAVVPTAHSRLQMQSLPKPIAGAFERSERPWEEAWRVGRDEGPGTPKMPRSPGGRAILASESRQTEVAPPPPQPALSNALSSAGNEFVPNNGYDDKGKNGEGLDDSKLAEETDTDKVVLNGERDQRATSRDPAEAVASVRLPAAARQDLRPSVLAVLEKQSPRISEVGDDDDGELRDRASAIAKPNAFWWVRTAAFDYASAILLTLNSLMMGFQAHEILSSGNPDLPVAYLVFDWIVFVAFITELICRILCFGYVVFFCGKNRYWNIFETMLVGIQIVEESANTIVALTDSNAEMNTGSGAFGILRILRLLRLVRMVRFVRLIRELHAMVVSILSSVRSFGWALVLLFILVYVMAIYVAQSLSELDRSTLITMSTEALGDEEALTSVWMIIFVLFQCMSGGMDWGGFANPLVKETGWISAIAFTFFISFTVFVIMNVVTGVFVDASTNSLREEKEKDLLTRLRESFEIADEDKSHTLTWKEFQRNMNHPRMKDYFKAVDLDPSASRGLFSILASEDGTVTLDDLVHGCLRLCGPARAIDQAMTEKEHGRMLRALHGTVRNIHEDIAWLSDLQRQVYMARDAQEQMQEQQA